MTQDVTFGLIVGVLLLIALLLGYRLVRGDRGIRISRLGVFIQRERFPENGDEPEDDVTREWPVP